MKKFIVFLKITEIQILQNFKENPFLLRCLHLNILFFMSFIYLIKNAYLIKKRENNLIFIMQKS
jgi:hypothetical protein